MNWAINRFISNKLNFFFIYASSSKIYLTECIIVSSFSFTIPAFYPFTPKHEYAYSPYCPYIMFPKVPDRENLSNYQEPL